MTNHFFFLLCIFFSGAFVFRRPHDRAVRERCNRALIPAKRDKFLHGNLASCAQQPLQFSLILPRAIAFPRPLAQSAAFSQPRNHTWKIWKKWAGKRARGRWSSGRQDPLFRAREAAQGPVPSGVGPSPCWHVRRREQTHQRAPPARLRVPGHAPKGSAARRDSLVWRQTRRGKRDKHVRGLREF